MCYANVINLAGIKTHSYKDLPQRSQSTTQRKRKV